MRLLLDTHIWLWSHLQPRKLTPEVAVSLEAETTELWLSPISVWEVMVLESKGRVSFEMDVKSWVTEALSCAPMRLAPLTTEIALTTGRIDLDHHDPADRFIAATALVHDLTLVTADRRLIAARGIPTMANR